MKIKFCPKCGSTNWQVKPLGIGGIVGGGGGLLAAGGKAVHPDIIECEDCHYTGIFPEIEKDKLKELQKKMKEKKSG